MIAFLSGLLIGFAAGLFMPRIVVYVLARWLGIGGKL